MKRLFLIRHAKSDWSISGLNDIDRPLNGRGYENAHSMGKKLAGMISGNILFISSPAVRAISTALIFAGESGYDKGKIKIINELYEADEKTYHKIFPVMDNFFDTVLIFGHNPTISNVVGMLLETGVLDLPTCSVSEIIVESPSWSDIYASKRRPGSQFSPKKEII